MYLATVSVGYDVIAENSPPRGFMAGNLSSDISRLLIHARGFPSKLLKLAEMPSCNVPVIFRF